MIRIAVNGALGQMGRQVLDQASADPSWVIVAGIDANAASAPAGLGFQVLTDIGQLDGPVDAIIDFSRPPALPGLLEAAKALDAALVLGTTGYDDDDRRQIAAAAELRPIFAAANMSFGVAVLTNLVRRAETALGAGFDVEICETHHRRKVDAPSGTALMLADAVASCAKDPMTVVTSRQQARQPGEIGVVAMRGGTVAGQHSVNFFGEDEVIELSHTALSRRPLASGALRATSWLVGKPAGLYTMDDLVAAS